MGFEGSGASEGFELEMTSLVGKACSPLLVLGWRDLKFVIDDRFVQLESGSRGHRMG